MCETSDSLENGDRGHFELRPETLPYTRPTIVSRHKLGEVLEGQVEVDSHLSRRHASAHRRRVNLRCRSGERRPCLDAAPLTVSKHWIRRVSCHAYHGRRTHLPSIARRFWSLEPVCSLKHLTAPSTRPVPRSQPFPRRILSFLRKLRPRNHFVN